MNKKFLAGLIALILLGALIIISYFARPYLKQGRVSRLEKNAEKEIARGELIDAEILIRKALELKPSDSGLHFKLGKILEQEGVFDQAREQYSRARQGGQSPEAGYQVGVMSYKMGKPEEAEKIFSENLAGWPNHLPTLYQLGWLMARQGKCPEAIAYFERIVGIKPNEAEAYNNLGYCLYTMDQPEKARDLFKRALELKPDLDSAKKSLETIDADLAGNPQPGNTVEPCPECK